MNFSASLRSTISMSFVRNIRHLRYLSYVLVKRLLRLKGEFSLLRGLNKCQAGHFSAYRPITYNSSTRKSLPRAVFKVVDSMI